MPPATAVSEQTPHVRARTWLSLGDWLTLWYAGRRDGRRDLPAWYTDGEFPPVTPQLVAIANQAQAWFEIERVKLVRATRDLARRESQLQGRISTLTRQLAELMEPGRAPSPLSEHELNARRLGEDPADVDPATIRNRRQYEYQKLRDVYDRRLDETQQALEAAQAELAELPDELDQHREHALARVAELRHLAGQRAAIYCRALVRRHSKGAALASVWRGWLPKLPSWAAAVETRTL